MASPLGVKKVKMTDTPEWRSKVEELNVNPDLKKFSYPEIYALAGYLINKKNSRKTTEYQNFVYASYCYLFNEPIPSIFPDMIKINAVRHAKRFF